MKLKDKKIGFCLTGSFCTFKNTLKQMQKLVDEGADVIPIMSNNSYTLDTKFGLASEFIEEVKKITRKDKIIHTIQEAEPIGPQNLTDIMIVAPCTRKYNC